MTNYYRYDREGDIVESDDEDPFELYGLMDDDEEYWGEMSHWRFDRETNWDIEPTEYEIYLLEG